MSDFHESELFSAYLDGEVTAAEQARVEQLLSGDPAARRLMDSLEALRARLQSLPAEKLGEDLSQRVLRAAERRMLVGEEDARPAPATPPQRPWWREIRWRGMLSRRAVMWSGLAVAIALMIKLNEPERRQGQVERDVAVAPQPDADDSAPRGREAAGAPTTARPAGPQPAMHAPGWKVEEGEALAKHTADRSGETAGDYKLTEDGKPAGDATRVEGRATAGGMGGGGMGGIAAPPGEKASGRFRAPDDLQVAANALRKDLGARDSEDRPEELMFGDSDGRARRKAARSPRRGGEAEHYAKDGDEGDKPAPEETNFGKKLAKDQQSPADEKDRMEAVVQSELKKAPQPAKKLDQLAKADVAKEMPKARPGAADLAADGHTRSDFLKGAKDLMDETKQGAGALTLSPSNEPRDHGGAATTNEASKTNVAGALGTGHDLAGKAPVPALPPGGGRGGVGGMGGVFGTPSLEPSALPKPAVPAPSAESIAGGPAGQSVPRPSAAPTPPAAPQAPAEAPAMGLLRGTPDSGPAGTKLKSGEGFGRGKEIQQDLARAEEDEAVVVECDVRPDVLQTRAFEQVLTRNGLSFHKEPAVKEAQRAARESVVVYRVDATPAQVEGVLAQFAQDPKTFYRFAVKPSSGAAHRSLADVERPRKPDAAAEPSAPPGRKLNVAEEYRRAAERAYARAQEGALAAEKKVAATFDESRKVASRKPSAPANRVVFVLRVVDRRPEAAAALKAEVEAAEPAKAAAEPAEPARGH